MNSPYFPAELWYMIWEELADDNRKRKMLGRQLPQTQYAAVNREWQSYFEPIHFGQLILSTPERICGLNIIVSLERRRLVQRIWLQVHLSQVEYLWHSNSDYAINIRPRLEKKNNRLFTSAVRSLFLALNKWNKDEANYGKGITLELGIHVKADDKVMSRHRKVKDMSGFDSHDLSQGSIGQASNGLVHGSQYLRHGERSVVGRLGVYGTPSEHFSPGFFWAVRDSWPRGLIILEKLRPCKVVAGFLIRREYLRCISPHGLGTILDKLPGLEHMSHEMWHLAHNYKPEGVQLDTEYHVLFSHRLPPLLKRLSVFQDFDKVHYGFSTSPRDLPPPTWTSLGQALANVSRNLEELSLAFIVDAKDFLYQFPPLSEAGKEKKKAWKNLTTLSLTSTHLRDPRNSDQPIADLLEAAGNAARRMPKLGTMEIWHAMCGEGAIFRYERKHGRNRSPAITWITSWVSFLDRRVIAAWEGAIPEGENLNVNTEIMVTPQSYGSVIPLLKLRDRMLHPVSVLQIELAMKNIEP